MDHLSKKERSWNMSRILSTNTKPEIKIRSFLHKNGFRYRLKNTLKGRPDVFLKKYNTVIFVHGCFWHGHKNCKRSGIPKTNTKYWKNKISSNINRDKKTERELKRNGMKVIVIWECQVNNIKILDKMVKHIL